MGRDGEGREGRGWEGREGRERRFFKELKFDFWDGDGELSTGFVGLLMIHKFGGDGKENEFRLRVFFNSKDFNILFECF